MSSTLSTYYPRLMSGLKAQPDDDSTSGRRNASIRWSAGEECVLGAEMGISTYKLHARGPMGLADLVTTKYVVSGDGQIRT